MRTISIFAIVAIFMYRGISCASGTYRYKILGQNLIRYPVMYPYNVNAMETKDWIAILISTIFGGLLGFGTVVLVESLKEPNLIFDGGSEDYDEANKCTFIKVVRLVLLKHK